MKRWLLPSIGLGALCLAIGSAGTLRGPVYDMADPDFAMIKAQFSAIEAGLPDPRVQKSIGVDLSRLRGGDWRTACLFGGYTSPSAVLTNLGATLDTSDRDRLQDLRTMSLRIAEVEEFEAMIAAIDEGGRAHLIHFNHGFDSAGQHVERCITKPDTIVSIYD